MTSGTAQQKDLFTKRFRRVKTKPAREANSIQIPLVSILRWTMRDDVIWRHVPNGEHRDPRVGAKLKAMGVLPGSADLEFFWRDSGYLQVMFMELKLPGKRSQDNQIEFCVKAKRIGAEYHVATSVDEALALLKDRGLLRADRPVRGVCEP